MDAAGLITVGDAAAKLGRSTEQVRRYLREGRLGGQRLGGQWFIDRATLDAFIADQRVPRGFIDKIRAASLTDPLGATIGIGGSGGGNIAQGKDSYRCVKRWRR